MNLFAKVFLCSRKVLAVTLPSIIMSLLTVEVATAQPQCFTIDTSGKLVNLEYICNVQPQAATGTNSLVQNTIVIKKTEIDRPLAERTYLLGDASIPVTLDTSRAIYYYGDRPVYIRRYRETQRFGTRNDARKALVGLQTTTRNVGIFRNNPFIIYQYQK